MKKIKVLSVFGTRPDAAKMCPLVRELERREQIESVVCVTAQHRQMLDQMLEAFDVKPDYDLDIMEKSQSLTDIMVKALPGIGRVIDQCRPDIVLAHGDTSTTLATALAAFYARVPVGHVEAGLRSFDRYSPYPEEMNRLLADRLAEVYFAPTEGNRQNLIAEGITDNVFVTGNTVIDGLKYTVKDDYIFDQTQLNGLDFAKEKVITLTAHRRENYGAPMEDIFRAVAKVAARPGIKVVYPVHLSPYVQETAGKYLAGCDNVMLIPPLGVGDMHNLMARSMLVMTDSGGLQEEAPALGKPVIVLRRETERPEAVEAGTVKIAGTRCEDILACTEELLEGGAAYQKMARAVNPYGDGQACRRIADDILYYFGMAEAPAGDFCP